MGSTYWTVEFDLLDGLICLWTSHLLKKKIYTSIEPQVTFFIYW